MQNVTVTGFPSPADAYKETPLDVLELIAPNPVSTFFLRLVEDAQIWDLRSGDILVVDRSLAPADGDLVVASEDGSLVLRAIALSGSRKAAQTPGGKTRSGAHVEVWGVVRAVVRVV